MTSFGLRGRVKYKEAWVAKLLGTLGARLFTPGYAFRFLGTLLRVPGL